MARSTKKTSNSLKLDETMFRPGMRLAVGLSGGADSVALLCALAERSRELGVVLHAAHLHHGLRGEEADGDREFCRDLAKRFEIPFHTVQVDVAAEAKEQGESVEEAARRLRYAWFRQLMREIPLDAVATAHTLDDQAETVLAKFLRGAWTEGLSGIHPVLTFPEGTVLRPQLGAGRSEIEMWLTSIDQAWREDSSNRHLTFTRNRIRHELLPLLETWNPKLREHMAQMAELAREEEAWWQAELARTAPHLILPGQPVRGGGRAGGSNVALDVTRLAALPPAIQRRLLRHAAQDLGSDPSFVATESLRELALRGRAGQKCEIAKGLIAERTHREVRLTVASSATAEVDASVLPEYSVMIPGEIVAPVYGVQVQIACSGTGPGLTARLRPWKPGDRVRVRHSGSPRKVKEVLERMKVAGSDRVSWPVLEIGGQIAWMRGILVEQIAGIEVQANPILDAPQG